MDPQRKQELLDQLRGLELPPEPAIWPLAAGWWLLAGLLLAALALWLLVRRLRRPSWKKSALREHRRITAEIPSAGGRAAAVAELSVLMRRVALAVQGRSAAAALTDDAWLAALDGLANSTEYTNGPGRMLQRHPYMPLEKIDSASLDALLQLTEHTIRKAEHNRARAPIQPPAEVGRVRL